MIYSNNKDLRAFTLIELLVVLVIISIGAVVAVPRISTGIDSVRFKGAVSEVVTFLRHAHMDAVFERKDITVSVDYKENILKRNDDQLLNIPADILVNTEEIDDDEALRYTFYNNGRGTGPRIEFVNCSERKAIVYVDILSGLAKYDLK